MFQLPSQLNQDKLMYAQKIPLTSFPTLNRCLGGGVGRGQVFSVMGYPGVGKSTLLRTIARDAISAGQPVMHYTICDLRDIEVQTLYTRLLLALSENEILGATPEFHQRVAAWSSFNNMLWVKEYKPKAVTVDSIRSHLNEMALTMNFNPSVIIVDYPDKLKPSLAKEDRWTNEAHNIDELVSIAQEVNAVVWWAWHPTKPASVGKISYRDDGESEVLTMADGKGSFEKCHGVDGVVSYNVNRKERGILRGRLWVDKLRRGRLLEHPITCSADFNIGQIVELGWHQQ